MVDSSGNLVVLILPELDFPVTVGAFDESFNGGPFLSVVNASLTFSTGADMAVFRLNNTGTTLMGYILEELEPTTQCKLGVQLW